ncbi:unnamed protein product [Amaranthus hypochondriacus]
MKRVVFSSSFICFFLLFTLSNGLRVIDLTQVHDHHHLQNKPSSDGSDSSKFIFPTKLSSVPEANKPEFEPESTEIEFKEVIEEVEKNPNVEYNYMDVMNRHPVRINAFNRFSLPIIRVKSHGCRQFHRLMHHPDRFIEANEVGFATVEENNHGSHHHHHHDHVEEDDQAAEMMTEILEEKKDNKDENEKELQKDLLKIGKFLGYNYF